MTDEFDLDDLDLGEKPAKQLLPMPDGPVPYIVLDIETIPDESRRELFGLDKPKEEQKPFSNPDIPMQDLLTKTIANITDIVGKHNPDDTWLEGLVTWERLNAKPRDGVMKLVKAIRESRAGDGPEAEAERIKKMSLTPEMLRIVSIGIGVGGMAAQPSRHMAALAIDGTTERDLLEWAWAWMAKAQRVVGYNVLGFDLPAIFVRSAMLGVPPARLFDMAPWKHDVIDLMALRYPKGSKADGLKNLAKYYSIPVPAGDVDGSQVYANWQAGKHEDIRKYQLSDIEVTEKLMQIWRGYFF